MGSVVLSAAVLNISVHFAEYYLLWLMLAGSYG